MSLANESDVGLLLNEVAEVSNCVDAKNKGGQESDSWHKKEVNDELDPFATGECGVGRAGVLLVMVV